MRNALLTYILDTTREEKESTIERYEEILAKLVQKPANEEELAALKQFIADTRVEVQETLVRGDKMFARLESFHKYGIELSKDDVHLAWSTMEYPKRVHDASSEAESRIEFDKIKMIDKLALEKNEFEMKLAEFGQRVKQAQAFDDYEKEAEYVEIVNGIQDSILEAKAKGKAFNDREQVFGFPPTEFLELMLLKKNWPRTGTSGT